MKKPDDAAARFKEGFSCSPAVVSRFSDDLGLDNDTAYKISCGFGAGIARTGNICGAVAGAVMVIGLKYGKATAGDDAAKERTYALVQEFITAFRAKNGSITCTELLGYDLRDPGQSDVLIVTYSTETEFMERMVRSGGMRWGSETVI